MKLSEESFTEEIFSEIDLMCWQNIDSTKRGFGEQCGSGSDRVEVGSKDSNISNEDLPEKPLIDNEFPKEINSDTVEHVEQHVGDVD